MGPQANTILTVFIAIRILQHLVERGLAWMNRKYFLSPTRQQEAGKILEIDPTSMAKAQAYSLDRYRFRAVHEWVDIIVLVIFLALGGLGLVEHAAIRLTGALGFGPHQLTTGLIFFGLLAFLSGLLSLPFDYYATFVIEEKFGFNKQTRKGFFMDRLKGIALGVVLGGLILAAILAIIQFSGSYWWVIAWITMFGFSLLTAWLYPTLLAPIFNKFTPVEAGELKTKISALANRIHFKAGDILVMDASKRSSHGNAYFTGVFGAKTIVLFDTLVKSLQTDEIIGVLAHELGHFKLHHIRWGLVRGFFSLGITFYLINLFIPMDAIYRAFGLIGFSSYGLLIVTSFVLGPLGFITQPFSHWLSQKHEYEADAFALKNSEQPAALRTALLKLRESSSSMPISHPWYSIFYLSHPPLIERLRKLPG